MNNKKRVIANEFDQSDDIAQDDKELIQELGKQKEKVSKPPTIPLIEQNEWRTEGSGYGLVIKKQKKDAPILSMNAVPGTSILSTEKERFKHDYTLRPDEQENDYNLMPVEDFGAALLRGMGWNQGKPVGKNPNGLIEPVLVNARPSLLGLGAEPAPELEPKKQKKLLPGDVIETKPVLSVPEIVPIEPDKIHKIGTKVVIISGSKKGNKGKIVNVSTKTDGIAVKIQLHI